MNSHSKTANVIGGKTARACDSCLRKRARWFCAADDAFLCQSCDVSVHSANQLASRHERVRIESSSWRAKDLKRNDDANENPPPLWHKGFTKKPRTPRSNKSRRVNKDDHVEGIGRSNPGVLVPEISSEETTMEEIDEQLFCRVPVLDDDTFAGELDDMISSDEFHGLKLLLNDQEASGLDMPVLCTTDMALDELSVDVDSLLGRGIDKGSYANQELCFKGESFSDNAYFENKKLKTEEENRRVKAAMDFDYDPGLDVARESLNWDFDYSTSPVIGEEEELGISCGLPMENLEIKEKEKEKRRINLKINYEEIISAWDCNVSPWINGSKPDINPDDCWPDFLGGGSEMDENSNGSNSGRSGGLDGEREARVLRYREKRRTRLFAKKIRYEVRKLNAEKRPRMKGRFVKRTSFLGSSVPTCVVNK